MMDLMRSKFRKKPGRSVGVATALVLTVVVASIFVALVVVRGQSQQSAPETSSNGITGGCRAASCTTVQPSTSPSSLRPWNATGSSIINSSVTVRVSPEPTTAPSYRHSSEPSNVPSRRPLKELSNEPSQTATQAPSGWPTKAPTGSPTKDPTKGPTASPTFSPSEEVVVSFYPGDLNVTENGLLMSAGLSSRIFARTGQRVPYENGNLSTARVHVEPDFGATYDDTRPGNPGGWIYVSNSEDRNATKGGVGAFTFDADGKVIDYQMLLEGSTANCGGGSTPWKTWISCEETNHGVLWQVDPLGERSPEVITLGNDTGGLFESFAYDLVTLEAPQFFVTEDDTNGPLRRWRPDNPNWDDPWSVLTGLGRTDYLMLDPSTGTFNWTSDIDAARQNALTYFPNTEGIECDHGIVYFVTKKLRIMYVLNLMFGTYTSSPTSTGADFNGEPDQMQRVFQTDSQLMFFTEDGGDRPGIYARSRYDASFVTILESSIFINMDQETTGLTFSPNGLHMYFAIQDAGIFYDVWRQDGLPFDGRSLNLKYNVNARR